jgi:hypothetical protein
MIIYPPKPAAGNVKRRINAVMGKPPLWLIFAGFDGESSDTVPSYGNCLPLCPGFDLKTPPHDHGGVDGYNS